MKMLICYLKNYVSKPGFDKNVDKQLSSLLAQACAFIVDYYYYFQFSWQMTCLADCVRAKLLVWPREIYLSKQLGRTGPFF